MLGESKLNIHTLAGDTEITLSMEDYKEAEEKGLSLSQHINRKFPTDAKNHGTAFAQAMASSGLLLSDDREYGLRPPSIKDILDGKAQLAGGAVTAPDGSNRQLPAGRLLYPAVIIDLLEDSLRENKESYNAAFMSMVAFTRSINSQRYDQVKIDYTRPRGARGQPISQLAEPTRMLSITTSDISKSIPVYSIGMEISKEALNAATLDLVALALREHSLEERSSQIENDFVNIVNGDVDSGQTALASVQADSFDPLITTAGTLTQKGWVKFLRSGWRRRTITDVVCDLDTYLAIEGRTGRPTKDFEAGQDERLNSVPRIMLPGIGGVNVFTTEESILGANTLVGLDRSKAMRRIVYAGAEYSAIEEFVMRKATAMRFDWAERIESAGYDQAFAKMTLTV